MRKFESILFVTDHRTSTDAGLARAVELAARSDGRLTLVDIVRDGHEVVDVILEARRRALEALAKPSRARGIGVESRLLLGDPIATIVKEVEHHGHDLVMKCSETPKPKRWPYTGVDFRLMRECPAPLWILKPPVNDRPLRILAALDPGSGDGRAGLDREILSLAGAVRALADGEIHLVHAWSLGREILRQVGHGGAQLDTTDTLENRARISLKRAVKGVLPAVTRDAVASHIEVCEGEPVDVIAEIAQREGIDLIVMGTAARTGVAGLVVGNTAEKVLARIDCSLLTTRSKRPFQDNLVAGERPAETAASDQLAETRG